MWFFTRKVQPFFAYPSSYKAAGCLFFTERLLLAGYQPHKKQPILSGLGGLRKATELPAQTAFRETVEELYHVEHVPRELIERLQKKLIPNAVLDEDGYVVLVFDLFQLLKLLRICKNYGVKSPLYSTMPTTLDDLLMKRLPDPSAEISHLCLFPLIDVSSPDKILDKSFLSDIRRILHHPDLPVTS